MPLDQPPYLLHLVRFGKTTRRLKIDDFWNAFSIINFVAAAASIGTLDEAEPLDVPAKIAKADIFV